MAKKEVKKENPNVDLSQDRLLYVGSGLVFGVVCAPSTWDKKRVSETATNENPPGTSANEWVVSKPAKREDDFNGVSHLPCPTDSNRTHWLINC